MTDLPTFVGMFLCLAVHLILNVGIKILIIFAPWVIVRVGPLICKKCSLDRIKGTTDFTLHKRWHNLRLLVASEHRGVNIVKKFLLDTVE